MDIQSYKKGVKIAVGNTNVFVNEHDGVEEGVIILTTPNSSTETNDKRLVIEGPGEYEFKGIHVKGTKKNNVFFFEITSNDRKVIFTSSDGTKDIPDDEPLDAVIVNLDSPIDESQISKMPYALVFSDKNNLLSDKIEAEKVKSVNLKKLNPEDKNIFVLS